MKVCGMDQRLTGSSERPGWNKQFTVMQMVYNAMGCKSRNTYRSSPQCKRSYWKALAGLRPCRCVKPIASNTV